MGRERGGLNKVSVAVEMEEVRQQTPQTGAHCAYEADIKASNQPRAHSLCQTTHHTTTVRIIIIITTRAERGEEKKSLGIVKAPSFYPLDVWPVAWVDLY